MAQNRKEWISKGNAGLLFGDASACQRALDGEPGLNNVLGVESAFAANPLAMDFLDPRSPFHGIKTLSTKIYQQFITPRLDDLSANARILDVGCGIGRFTAPLARRFKNVVALDPSLSSLKACQRHLFEENLHHAQLHWADISLLDEWPPDTFDAVLGMELICYVAQPLDALRRLIRVTRPGGLILVSVEGMLGSLCTCGAGDPLELIQILNGKPLAKAGDLFVQYFDPAGLKRLLLEADVTDAVVEGSHYFGEGPFWQSIDDTRLADPDYMERIIQAEQDCRSTPLVHPWARVFSAAGRKR